VQTWNLSERVAALESSVDLIKQRQSDIGARIEALPAVMKTEFQALGQSGDAQSDRMLRSVSTVEQIVRDQSVQIDALTRGLNENRARLDSLIVQLLPTGSLPSRGQHRQPGSGDIGDPVDWGTPQYAPADSLNE
jgi:ABC-type transporter Mla subunit MlaD